MKYVYSWKGQPAVRSVTIPELQAGKNNSRWIQVSANTTEESKAADEAGIEMLICNSVNVKQVREGSNKLFLTALIPPAAFATIDDIMREAFKALELGADAILTSRSLNVVNALADEDIPVMGHLGMVPGRSAWSNGNRAAGQTANEAFELYQHCKLLEDEGALMVLAELIPAEVMAEITKRTKLITVSWGSGAKAEVFYQSLDDIYGKEPTLPAEYAYHCFGVAHSRKLTFEERVEALMSFRQAVKTQEFPGRPDEEIGIAPKELDIFRKRLPTRVLDNS